MERSNWARLMVEKYNSSGWKFQRRLGDCLYLETVLHHGEKKSHTLEIRILPDAEKEAAPFYLMALIVA